MGFLQEVQTLLPDDFYYLSFWPRLFLQVEVVLIITEGSLDVLAV